MQGWSNDGTIEISSMKMIRQYRHVFIDWVIITQQYDRIRKAEEKIKKRRSRFKGSTLRAMIMMRYWTVHWSLNAETIVSAKWYNCQLLSTFVFVHYHWKQTWNYSTAILMNVLLLFKITLMWMPLEVVEWVQKVERTMPLQTNPYNTHR